LIRCSCHVYKLILCHHANIGKKHANSFISLFFETKHARNGKIKTSKLLQNIEIKKMILQLSQMQRD